jgi:hypothetical protein
MVVSSQRRTANEPVIGHEERTYITNEETGDALEQFWWEV